MKDNFKNVTKVFENYMCEADEEEEIAELRTIKIFYKDLSMDGKQEVLNAIDSTFEYVDVFSDDIVRENIDESLSKRPLFMMTGEEIVNKMNIKL